MTEPPYPDVHPRRSPGSDPGSGSGSDSRPDSRPELRTESRPDRGGLHGGPGDDPGNDPEEGPGDDELVGTVTWAELAEETADRLARSPRPEVAGPARRHGHLIAMRAAGAEARDWVGRSADRATVRGVAALDRMTARRLEGEPLQYVLGQWDFRRLDLYLDRRVLIPRPETEVVAGLALDELTRLAPDGGPVTAADLGTGSGAIGLSLAREHQGVEVWLTDVADDALAVARANLAGLGQPAVRVRVTAGSWFEALPGELRGRLGLVVSNPPYVSDDDDLPPEVADWEPSGALFGGPDGTDHLRHLVEAAPAWLRPDGALVLELAPDQAQPLAATAGSHFAQVEIHRDLADRPRAVVARHPVAPTS